MLKEEEGGAKMLQEIEERKSNKREISGRKEEAERAGRKEAKREQRKGREGVEEFKEYNASLEFYK